MEERHIFGVDEDVFILTFSLVAGTGIQCWGNREQQ